MLADPIGRRGYSAPATIGPRSGHHLVLATAAALWYAERLASMPRSFHHASSSQVDLGYVPPYPDR